MFRQVVKKPIKYKFVESLDHLKPKTYTICQSQQTITTTLAGEKETTNTAYPGDFIMSGPDDERYVLTSTKLITNYNIQDTVLTPRAAPRMAVKIDKNNINKFATFKPEQSQNAYYIIAPWGEEMLVKIGDYLIKEGSGLYRVEAKMFRRTYVVKN
jgi:hypothetical protein